MLTPAEARRGLHIYHVSAPTPKHVENSIRGVRHAWHSPLFNAIDLDTLITKADPHCPHHGHPEHGPGDVCRGHLVGTHWGQPMISDGFRDPLGKLPHHTRVRDMTLDQATRLVAPGDYRIHPTADLLAECGRGDVVAVVEPKADTRFELDWPWRYMGAVAHRHGTDLRAYALRNLPTTGAGLRRVQAARRNQVPAWII